MRSLAASLFVLFSSPALAEVPRVATDIAPVHSLVEQVMQDVGNADLLLRPGASAHHYSMKPSDARKLQQADIVFWIGESLTPWLEKPVETLGDGATVVELLGIDGTELLEFTDEHDEHGSDHDDVQSENEDDHAHLHHDGVDPHAWLDPENAKVWLAEIAEVLSEADPENAATYKSNATSRIAELDRLKHSIEDKLSSASDFAVMHDSVGYFSLRFALKAPLALADSEAKQPGPARVSELRHETEERQIACVLTEPGESIALIETVFETQEIKVVEFDPVGSQHEPGAELYAKLLGSLGDIIASCSSQ